MQGRKIKIARSRWRIRILKTSTGSLNFKQYSLPSVKLLRCETLTYNIRPYIPKSYRMKIFHQMHVISHPSIKSSINILTWKLIGPNIRKDVQLWTWSCMACQKSKIIRHTKSSFGESHPPPERFTDVNIDLMGP